MGTAITYCEQRCHPEFAHTGDWVSFFNPGHHHVNICVTYPLVCMSIGERGRLG